MNVYTLPFKKGAKVAELGGGANPSFRPNIDMRSTYSFYSLVITAFDFRASSIMSVGQFGCGIQKT